MLRIFIAHLPLGMSTETKGLVISPRVANTVSNGGRGAPLKLNPNSASTTTSNVALMTLADGSSSINATPIFWHCVVNPWYSGLAVLLG